MEPHELKTLFDNGVLKKATIYSASFEQGYNLIFTAGKNKFLYAFSSAQ